MKLQEQISRIKSMMGVINEDHKTEDDFDFGVDTSQEDADKWKLSDDHEDEPQTDIEGTSEDVILKKVANVIAEKGMDVVDINYLGQQPARVINKKTGNAVKIKVNMTNVTIVLDNGEPGEDEYVSFVILSGKAPRNDNYMFNDEGRILQARNMKYHHNGEEIELNDRVKDWKKSSGEIEKIPYNPIFDLLSNNDIFRKRVFRSIIGAEKHFQDPTEMN